MPGFNQTGPSYQGPKTGWGRGVCNIGRPVYAMGIRNNAGLGRGPSFGRGFRCGFGCGTSGYSGRALSRNREEFLQMGPEDAQIELERLRTQAESMQHSLEAIKQRLKEIEKSK